MPAGLVEIVQRRAPIYDKSQDGHYNLISALHKSCAARIPMLLCIISRACWMQARTRSISRAAWCGWRSRISDLPNPQALVIANAAKDAYDFLGSPEGELAIAQAVIYVATAPKSNAGYMAYGAAKKVAKEAGSLVPPKHILNAPTKLMQQEDYGAGYDYDHDAPEAFSGRIISPRRSAARLFTGRSSARFERELKKRLEYWAKLRQERK